MTCILQTSPDAVHLQMVRVGNAKINKNITLRVHRLRMTCGHKWGGALSYKLFS